MPFHLKAVPGPAQNHRAYYLKIGTLSILMLAAPGGIALADDPILGGGTDQLMGRVTADVGMGITDIWANDISDENLKRTKLDDMKEVADWQAKRTAYDWKDGREGKETATLRSLFRSSVDAEFTAEKFAEARLLLVTLLRMSDTIGDPDDINPALVNAVIDDPLALKTLILYSDYYPDWSASRDGLSKFEAFERDIGGLPNAVKHIIVAERIAQTVGDVQTQVERFNALTAKLADPAAYQGGLTKAGIGTLILQGVNTYNGETRIDAGLLVLDRQKAGQDGIIPSLVSPVMINRNGAFQADGLVHNLVTVNGLLNGTGTIGDLMVKKGGVVSPGKGVGTLSVSNNATFDKGGVFDVRITADYSKSNRLAVAGKATLLGGVVNIHLASDAGLLTEDVTKSLFLKNFDILTAGGGVTDQFESVSPRYNYITPYLDYTDKNKVVLGFDFTPEVKTQRALDAAKKIAEQKAEEARLAFESAEKLRLAGEAEKQGLIAEEAIRLANSEAEEKRLKADLLLANIEGYLSPEFLAIGVRTHNQKGVWRGIQSLGAANEDLLKEVTGSTVGEEFDFDALSGEVHASLSGVLAADSHFISDAATARLRNAFGGVTGKAQAVTAPLAYGPDSKVKGSEVKGSEAAAFAAVEPAPATTALWGEAYGSWAHEDSDGNASGYSRSTGGFVTGADGVVAEDWRLGVLAGYGNTSLRGNGKASVDSYQIGLYGGTKIDALGLRFGASYAHHEIDTKRTADFGSLHNEHEASYDAGSVQLFGELGYEIETPFAVFEPFAAASYVHVKTDGFSEDGADSNLTGASSGTDLTVTTIGLRASHVFTIQGGATLTARGMLGWNHGFGDITPESRVAFSGGQGFTTRGQTIAEDAAIIEAGFDLGISKSATLGLSYTGQFSSQAHDNAIKADLSVRF